MKRRGFLAVFCSIFTVPVFSQGNNSVEPKKGRVKLELPLLADNGNSVSMKVSVDSPMTEADHVRTIRLISDRNPEREMATFHLGPRAGVAEISSRVRLAGSQRVTAIAEMSDGSRWMDTADVVVTLSACLDGTG